MADLAKPTAVTLDDQLAELLAKFPHLAVRPNKSDTHFGEDDELRLIGAIRLDDVELKGLPRLGGAYRIKIIVPRGFPTSLPSAYALEDSIPRDYHTYSDGKLCLGAPLHIRAIVNHRPTLFGFVSECVVPYLYRHRHLQLFGIAPWGELEHRFPGLLQYYEYLFGTSDPNTCLEFLRLAALRKRVANKCPCPCSSALRLGRCHHLRINRFRDRCGRAAIRDAWRALKHALDEDR